MLLLLTQIRPAQPAGPNRDIRERVSTRSGDYTVPVRLPLSVREGPLPVGALNGRPNCGGANTPAHRRQFPSPAIGHLHDGGGVAIAILSRHSAMPTHQPASQPCASAAECMCMCIAFGWFMQFCHLGLELSAATAFAIRMHQFVQSFSTSDSDSLPRSFVLHAMAHRRPN